MARPVELDPTLKVVNEALHLTTRSGLSQLLRRVAGSVQADGCVLWQEHVPVSDPDGARLFTLGQWFDGDHVHRIHDLPIKGSATGLALKADDPVYIVDREKDGRAFHPPEHLKSPGVSFCAVPIVMPGGARGSLNAY